MKVSTILSAELCAALLIGGVPALLVLTVGGPESMAALVKGSVAPDAVIYWYFFLTFSFFLAWSLDHFTYPDNRRSKYAIAFVVYVLQQAGSSMRSLYRLLAGGLLVAVATWPAFEPETASVMKLGKLFLIASGCLLTASVLTQFHDRLSRSISDPLSKLQQSAL